MSVLQIGDLVTYQLRTAYLTEVADGVGERLITLNENIVNSAPFKAAGWRANPGLIKRTHSPPIPTAVASEYFRAPRSLGFTLEDEQDGDGGLLGGGGGVGGTGGGSLMGGGTGPNGGSVVGGGIGRRGRENSVISGGIGGGADNIMGSGPSAAATKRRRRREQLEDDEDSSDLSDESDEDGSAENQRAAQQIKFAKMPIRHRSGSSPLQSSNLRNPPIGPSGTTETTPASTATLLSSPTRNPPPPRRGSQTALEAVKERVRRDTVTSSEVSSENEFDASGFHRQRDRDQQERERERESASSRATSRGKSSTFSRVQGGNSSYSSGKPGAGAGAAPGGDAAALKRQQSDLLEDEREDDDDEVSDEDESDASDISSAFGGSLDSASILHAVSDNPLNQAAQTSDGPIVGTPPRQFTRAATVRRSQHPLSLMPVGDLPPPRPISMIRPVSMAPPRSLLSELLQAKKTKSVPFDSFASLSGQGEQNPIMVRIYVPFSKQPSKPFEVAIRPSVHQDQRSGDRAVTVADLIGLSLWRYNEEKRDPPLPAERLNVNWWTLRMVEEGGEVDDDFPPLERKRPLASFTTANNNKGTRFRSNSKVYDDFGLVEASQSEFADNKVATPQFTDEAQPEPDDVGMGGGVSLNGGDDDDDGERTPRNMTPQPGAKPSAFMKPPLPPNSGEQPLPALPKQPQFQLKNKQFAPLDQPRMNPILTTTYRHNANHADAPAPSAAPNTTRGRKKLLRVHIHSVEAAAPGQMMTVEVTTDTYLEEVLDIVCKKRNLDKANHMLKIPGSGAVVLTDREVSSIGNVTDLDLYRKRFATEGGAGSSGAAAAGSGSPGSGSSPKVSLDGISSSVVTGIVNASNSAAAGSRRFRKAAGTTPGYMHPLRATTNLNENQNQINDANYKKYTVWRRQGLKIMGSSERVLTIDGEYVHIMHAASVNGTSTGKTTTVHFSNVVGCKVSLRHPTHFKLIVYKATESKRYDFEAKTADEASEIVGELKKAMSPYRDI